MLGEQQYFVWDAASPRTKWLDPPGPPWGTQNLYVNGQNENLLNVRITTYLIGATAVSYKQNLSRQADAIWKERNEWLCQKL